MNRTNKTPATAEWRTSDNVLVCRLALERCQQHLSHLHAILHLCIPEPDHEDGRVAMKSMHKIISSMAQELSYSAETLA